MRRPRAAGVAPRLARLLRASVLAAMLPGTALAADSIARLADAQAALSAGRYTEAYELYRAEAERRADPLAAFTLGLFHQLGWGRPVDATEACRWFAIAAAKELPAAEHFAGDCARPGGGAAQPDPAAALAWYERAAQHGHLISLCSMAEMHAQGEGVAPDRAKAFALCARAANAGLPQAQVRLARLHLAGAPSPADYDEAVRWLESAARNGSAEGQYWLGVVHRDGLGRAPSPAAARHWFEEAASQGYLPAYLPTARSYWDAPPDLVTGRDPVALAKAYVWLAALVRRTPVPLAQVDAKGLLAQVRAEMPATWLPDLDRKVDQHLRALTSVPAPAAQLAAR